MEYLPFAKLGMGRIETQLSVVQYTACLPRQGRGEELKIIFREQFARFGSARYSARNTDDTGLNLLFDSRDLIIIWEWLFIGLLSTRVNHSGFLWIGLSCKGFKF
jgi:hypothetical protein